MSDAANIVQELTGSAGTLSLYPGAPYEEAILSLFADAAYHDDASLTGALDATQYAPLTLTGMSDGTYTNENAAFDLWVDELTGDSLILAFRGTDDLSGSSNFLASLTGSADAAGWTDTAEYYDLMAGGLAQVDAYAAANDVSLVYVTGHSLGGAAAAYYLTEHENTDAIQYLGVTFGAPGILSPGDVVISGGDISYSAQFYEASLQAAYSADPRLTAFVIDQDPATYFGVKTGAIEISYDYPSAPSASDFSVASFLEDPAAYTAYHDIGLYEDAAVNLGELISGAAIASDAAVTFTVSLLGQSTTGVLAYAS